MHYRQKNVTQIARIAVAERTHRCIIVRMTTDLIVVARSLPVSQETSEREKRDSDATGGPRTRPNDRPSVRAVAEWRRRSDINASEASRNEGQVTPIDGDSKGRC
jgi:hypothetical protein